ncbi:MAG: hypothetical protein OIN87_00925 [Candidatus Methanoperedens sp.]|nr:hypothetical protein [Candidatus Methanoperedens sp.]
MKAKNYDYYLIIITTLILFGIGVVSLYGITYYMTFGHFNFHNGLN